MVCPGRPFATPIPENLKHPLTKNRERPRRTPEPRGNHQGAESARQKLPGWEILAGQAANLAGCLDPKSPENRAVSGIGGSRPAGG